ncbi:PASTA domain-containing protein [Streptomyces sp. NPDC007088]|uniref:PASTA domain-containing protein n=1 Tax=Streptomyces sp. NPDC007088 TaxID=3364773 RepID=UPI0036B5676C
MTAEIPDAPETVLVPRLVGLMSLDAVEQSQSRGLVTETPDRPEAPDPVAYVVRQYPAPDTVVLKGSVVTVWFDAGPGEDGGGSGVREPLRPEPGSGGMLREANEPDEDGGTEEPAVLS